MLLSHQRKRDHVPAELDAALALSEKAIILPTTLGTRIRLMGRLEMAIAKPRIGLNWKLRNRRHHQGK